MRLTGRSRERPNIVYVYDTAPNWQLRMGRVVIGERFREYDTLGDGDTAHTPDRMTSIEHLPDWVASMRVTLRDAILARRLDYVAGPRTVDAAAVRALLAVRYDADRPQWYSIETGELRLSRAPSRRHDKRWHEVREYDGGGRHMDALRMYERAMGHELDPMDRFEWLAAANREVGSCGWLPELLGWPGDPGGYGQAMGTLRVLQDLCSVVARVSRWEDER